MSLRRGERIWHDSCIKFSEVQRWTPPATPLSCFFSSLGKHAAAFAFGFRSEANVERTSSTESRFRSLLARTCFVLASCELEPLALRLAEVFWSEARILENLGEQHAGLIGMA